MSKDDLLSKRLVDIEEKQKGYLARRVEASEKERVDVISKPLRAEPVVLGSTTITGGEPETTVDILTPGATTATGVEPGVSIIPPSASESRL